MEDFTGSWAKGSYDSPQQSLQEHFLKHGDEVGAEDVTQYLRKAEEFKIAAKKGSRKTNVSGATPGVKRYSKNGRYIDLDSDNNIISFGSY
jgi:hypothetical protein